MLPAKKQKQAKSEFDKAGLKIIPAEYTGMQVEGLTLASKVSREFRERIANDRFFELSSLFKLGVKKRSGKAQSVEQHMKNFYVHDKEPTRKSEFYQQLYKFCFFYSQCYPGKSSSLFDYAHFLTARGSKVTLEGLVELDNGLRRLFCDNPGWHWQTNRLECQEVINEVLSNDDYKVKERSAFAVAPRPSGNNFRGRSSSFRGRGRARGRRGGRSRGRGGFSGYSQPSGSWSSPGAPCIKYNEGACLYGTSCFRPHVCYACKDATHVISQCTKTGGVTLPGAAK